MAMKSPIAKVSIRLARHFKPPEGLTVSEWADKYRVLSPESSAEAGRWRTKRTPYLKEPMDAFTDPSVSKIVIVASSQVGKSELEANIISYIIDQDPGSILYIHPSLEDAKRFSTQRVAPMIRDCRKLRSKVHEAKSRDSKNTMLQKTFPGGVLTLAGSNAPAGLASIPARYIIGDELDRWSKSAGTEGDPLSLAEARQTTFYNAKSVYVSTPTIKGQSLIAREYDLGTMERWCTQCPACKEYSEITFDRLSFDFEKYETDKEVHYDIKSIEYVCPHCGSLHDEATMRKQPAKWIAQSPKPKKKGVRSFWITAFCSPWVSWEKIVHDFLTKRHDPALFQVFYNTVLGKLWENRGDVIDEDTALSRLEDYGLNEDGTPIEVPDGVVVLTMGVDTQDDRLEYEIRGWGHYNESWGIQRGVIMGRPDREETWQALDDLIERTWYTKDRKYGFTVAFTAIDSGGHFTQEVYEQCRRRRARRVFPIKGQGGEGIPFTKVPSKVDVRARTGAKVELYSLGVDSGKATIMKNLEVQESGPGYCHFPKGFDKGYNRDYFSGLLSERPVSITTKGVTKMQWKKISEHARNEPLDCFVYALAGFKILNPDTFAYEKRMIEALSPPKIAPNRPVRGVRRTNGSRLVQERTDEW